MSFLSKLSYFSVNKLTLSFSVYLLLLTHRVGLYCYSRTVSEISTYLSPIYLILMVTLSFQLKASVEINIQK